MIRRSSEDEFSTSVMRERVRPMTSSSSRALLQDRRTGLTWQSLRFGRPGASRTAIYERLQPLAEVKEEPEIVRNLAEIQASARV
jgi:hypothetical protein